MKRMRMVLVVITLISLVLGVTSCDVGQLAAASKKRITFALVIDTRAYNGKMVYADVLDNPGGSLFTTVEAPLESYPNTVNHAWARMTTLEELDTNRRYFLEFFIDLDGNGTKTTGDLAGTQHFDVMPNATWAETKYFSADLEVVP
jgi:hypothetical protein